MGLDTVELVLAVEEEFGIAIPDEEAARLHSVSRLHDWIVNELRRRQHDAVDPAGVFARLRDIVCQTAGVPPERVTPEARFVEDLGLD